MKFFSVVFVCLTTSAISVLAQDCNPPNCASQCASVCQNNGWTGTAAATAQANCQRCEQGCQQQANAIIAQCEADAEARNSFNNANNQNTKIWGR